MKDPIPAPQHLSLNVRMPKHEPLKEVVAERVLGAWFQRNTQNTIEIRRRRGEAWSTIKSLRKVWKGTQMRKRTKIKKADSYAFGTIPFPIAAMTLNKSEEALIHSFQNRVLRHVTRSPPVWDST